MASHNYAERSIEEHKKHAGKWAITSLMSLETQDDLSIAYTPGVAAPCLAIAKDKSLAYDMTMKGRTVAVVSDGSSVLGLGNIGPEAGLPVMEGKAVLYKKYANIDAVPIVLASQNADDIVEAVRMIAPTFGGIHLEDIAAPICFDVEKRLIELLDIPVMHDDQHATAIVVLAGLMNAAKVVGRELSSLSVVVNGAGAAGVAITRLLIDSGVANVVLLDSKGIVGKHRTDLSGEKLQLSSMTNAKSIEGGLADAMTGADVFIGVSRPHLVTQDMVRSMAKNPIVFALANPVPEIEAEDAKAAGAAVIATGRSDYPNQINNVLVYPGLFRGLLNRRASKLTSEMKIAAATALAGMVSAPIAECIIPRIVEVNPAEVIANAIESV
ncbi:MAG: NADP-dependent malic enzyme [Patescibacteria group bacterium]|jgi:malate dehydrogenase (oxaloacetate-decarboxylating)